MYEHALKVFVTAAVSGQKSRSTVAFPLVLQSSGYGGGGTREPSRGDDDGADRTSARLCRSALRPGPQARCRGGMCVERSQTQDLTHTPDKSEEKVWVGRFTQFHCRPPPSPAAFCPAYTYAG
jgi:hypothetical protein